MVTMSTLNSSEAFILLVQEHLAHALLACGSGEGTKERNLELAKLEISVLETLQEKTRGNLSDEEQRILADALHEARMAFVWACQKKEVSRQDSPTPSETSTQQTSSS